MVQDLTATYLVVELVLEQLIFWALIHCPFSLTLFSSITLCPLVVQDGHLKPCHLFLPKGLSKQEITEEHNSVYIMHQFYSPLYCYFTFTKKQNKQKTPHISQNDLCLQRPRDLSSEFPQKQFLKAKNMTQFWLWSYMCPLTSYWGVWISRGSYTCPLPGVSGVSYCHSPLAPTCVTQQVLQHEISRSVIRGDLRLLFSAQQ